MNNNTVDLAKLRGSLPAKGPGARGLERFARNPKCHRIKAITAAEASPADVARQVYGEPIIGEGQSPFAISRGNRFEKVLFANNAERIVELYRRAERFSAPSPSVLNLDLHIPGKSSTVFTQRQSATLELIARRAAGEATPELIVHPRLVISLFGSDYQVEPDALVAEPGTQLYRIVEIKSYSDRRGKTSASKIRQACRQSAVGVVAMRRALVEVGSRLSAEARCDLILAYPGSFYPTLRPMHIEREVFSLERALNRAPEELAKLALLLTEGDTLDQAEVLDRIPNHYEEACREHCALARVCKRQALATCDPALLGSQVSEELAGVVDLRHLMAVIQGEAEPVTPEEAAHAARLRRALDERRRVLSHVG